MALLVDRFPPKMWTAHRKESTSTKPKSVTARSRRTRPRYPVAKLFLVYPDMCVHSVCKGKSSEESEKSHCPFQTPMLGTL